MIVEAKQYQLTCAAEFNSTKLKFNIEDDENIILNDSVCDIVDIDNDGKKELFVYLDSMVNACGYIYTYSKNEKLYNIRYIDNEVCDYIVVNNIVVSHYREGGVWEYDYFEIDERKVIESLQNRIQKKTLTHYNNIAYYLQKANANEEAIYLLEEILKKFPKRTVAHYNIADAYWAIGKKKKAKEHYITYIEQMKAKGKAKRIPKIVRDRVLKK
jgi:tetratricopeptide (TPR) repeat protein